MIFHQTFHRWRGVLNHHENNRWYTSLIRPESISTPMLINQLICFYGKTSTLLSNDAQIFRSLRNSYVDELELTISKSYQFISYQWFRGSYNLQQFIWSILEKFRSISSGNQLRVHSIGLLIETLYQKQRLFSWLAHSMIKFDFQENCPYLLDELLMVHVGWDQSRFLSISLVLKLKSITILSLIHWKFVLLRDFSYCTIMCSDFGQDGPKNRRISKNSYFHQRISYGGHKYGEFQACFIGLGIRGVSLDLAHLGAFWIERLFSAIFHNTGCLKFLVQFFRFLGSWSNEINELKMFEFKTLSISLISWHFNFSSW